MLHERLTVRLLTAAVLLSAACLTLLSCDRAAESAAVDSAQSLTASPDPWPPALFQPYPDLDLLDVDGNPVKLSDFAGKVILIEPVGMSCPACNGFAGAHEKGGFRNVTPQRGAISIEDMLARTAPEVDLHDPDLVFIHLLLYDRDMGSTDVEDARDWEQHFDIAELGGKVLVPRADLRNQATYKLIPGFQLVDRNFVLRFDASGHHPEDSYRTLLGAIPRLLDEAG